MSEEIIKKVDELGNSWAEFQKNQKAKSTELESTTATKEELIAKSLEIANDMAKMTEEIDAIKAAASRVPKVDVNAKGTPKCIKGYNDAMNDMIRGKEGAEAQLKEAAATFKAEMKADPGLFAEFKTMYVGSDPDGGFGVGREEGGMINPILQEFSNMRMRASVRTGSKPELRYTVNKKGAGSVVKASELQAYVATATPNIGEQIIVAHTHYALPTITEQMLEDADFDVFGFMNSEVGEQFALFDDNQGFLGDGAGEGKGILTRDTAAASGTVPYGSVALYNSGGPTSFVEENLIEMSGSLKRPYYTGSVNWFIRRQDFFTKLATLKNGENDFRLITNDFTNGVSFKMLGFDVDFAPDMPSTGTGGNLGLAFGNFKQACQYYDRTGITIKRFEEVESPLLWWRYRRRNGFDVTNFEAYSLMQMST